MAERPGEARTHQGFIVEPSSRSSDAIRYGLASAFVAAVAIGSVYGLGQVAPDQDASEVDSAVFVDLPPEAASSQPVSDATEGPVQQAAQASSAQEAPEHLDPAKDSPKPIVKPEPQALPALVDTPPPIEPDPPAVLERKRDEMAPPPKPVVAAPATQGQDEHAPTGSRMPVQTEANDSADGRPRASAHAITLWQKSMMRKLETAKRHLVDDPRQAGTVRIAFAIDGTGALVSARVAESSGSASLDRAATRLVLQAAPFPAPPAGTTSRDLSFVVPIRFRK